MQKRVIISVLLLCFSYVLSFSDSRYDLLSLTEEEKLFLIENPVIRVGNEIDWLPYDFSINGEAKGVSVDFLELLGSIAGFQIEWVNGYSWDELLEQLKKKNIDLVLNAAMAPERENYMSLTNRYLSTSNGFIALRGGNLDTPLSDLSNKRVALIPSYYVEKVLKRYFPELIPVYVETPWEGIQAVLDGDADCYPDDFGSLSYIESNQFYGILNTFPLPRVYDDLISGLGFGVRKDWNVLKSILNKTMNWVSAEEIDQILESYGMSKMISNSNNILMDVNTLTRIEIDWIIENRTINISELDSLPPISYYDENHKFSGVAKGYLDALEERLSIEFIYSGGGYSMHNSLDSIRNKETMLIPSISATHSREDILTFSSPYMHLPIAAYCHSDSVRFIRNTSELIGYKVAAIEGHAIIESLIEDYPEIEITPVKNAFEGLKLVSRKKADFYVGDIYVTNREISISHFRDIMSVGQIPYSYTISMGVRNDQPVLASIINKSLQRISEERGTQIEAYWLSTDYKKKLDPQIVEITLILLSLALFILLFQYRKNKIKQNIMAEYALKDQLTGLYNRHYLENFFNELQRRAISENECLVFIIFDIDKFKLYNDSYGHNRGDEVIQEVAQCLLSVFKRSSDKVIRMGGEEYAVLCTVKSQDEAMQLAEQARIELLNRSIPQENNLPLKKITLSGGLAVHFPSKQKISFENMYNAADKQLYKAKEQGRNKIL